MRRRYLKRFFTLSWTDKTIFLEASFFLLFWHTTVKLLPYNWYKPWLGKQMKTAPETLNHKPELVDQIAWAIKAGSRYLPWRPVCFPQALAGRTMLKLRSIKSVMFLGALPGQGEKFLDLHSWLMCGEEIVTGGEKSRNYQIFQIYY
jgi:hypothetical protein